MGNKALAGKQQGTFVINISYKDLKSLEIPLLKVEEQKMIAEEYEQERSRYVESIRLAEDRWNGVIERLQNTILKVKQ